MEKRSIDTVYLFTFFRFFNQVNFNLIKFLIKFIWNHSMSEINFIFIYVFMNR